MLMSGARIAGIALATALLTTGSPAEAQRRSEADYTQGLQQSALAFAAQNQWRNAEPANRHVVGRRQAGRMYDEPPADPRFVGRPAYVRPFWR